ncbi:hypothetical protein B0H63DRAFT_444017 [Podospora didyma]|uniref:Uncharacterized protein n=1 Tax=Podospora didyma TaxID=330526 RepID=A0AAE0U7L6_9PEZI|nr:hypothetical protein B0H63DRAFT_444017 [Podospora didyma]
MPPKPPRATVAVVDLCTESVRIYPADEGGRDVFALGSIIVKSSHLHTIGGTQHTEIDYSYADANEFQAISTAKSALRGVHAPDMYFAGKVLIQERLPGVGLTVAWPYPSRDQKESFKPQARKILRQLHTVKPADGRQARSHVIQDPFILSNGRIRPLGDILFSNTNTDPDMSFMHNDFTESNCIVNNDKIDIMFWNDLYDAGPLSYAETP